MFEEEEVDGKDSKENDVCNNLSDEFYICVVHIYDSWDYHLPVGVRIFIITLFANGE